MSKSNKKYEIPFVGNVNVVIKYIGREISSVNEVTVGFEIYKDRNFTGMT